jgi:hypothetical protein
MATIRILHVWFLAVACVTASADAGFTQGADVAPIATIDRPANFVRTDGTRLYAIADKTMNIFDTAGASSPRHLGGYTFPESVRAVTVSGAMVYVSAEFNLLRIVDAHDAAAPVERASLPVHGGIRTMAMSEPDLVVMTTSLEGFEAVDVSNPSAPVRVSSNLFTDSYSQGVAAAGRLVVATDSSTGVYVFDLTMPKSIEVLGTAPLVYARLGKEVPPAWISPDVAFGRSNAASPATTLVVLDKVAGRVEILDLTDPRKPEKIGMLELGRRAQCFAVHESRVYVGSRQGVQVIDVSTPGSPTVAGTFKTAQPPQDVSVSKAHVFVAMGRGGVAVFHNSSFGSQR